MNKSQKPLTEKRSKQGLFTRVSFIVKQNSQKNNIGYEEKRWGKTSV